MTAASRFRHAISSTRSRGSTGLQDPGGEITRQVPCRRAGEDPALPLENVVLLPDGSSACTSSNPLPQLMEHALAGDRRVGMIAVRPEGSGEIRPATAAVRDRRAPASSRSISAAPGRFQLLLRATERFRVCGAAREPGRLYRISRSSRCRSRSATRRPPARCDRVVGLLAQLAERTRGLCGPSTAPSCARSALSLHTGVAQSLALPTLAREAVAARVATLAERLERLAGASISTWPCSIAAPRAARKRCTEARQGA